MTDEEIEVVEDLIKLKDNLDVSYYALKAESLETILNLIKKQQSRIQDLEEINQEHKEENGRLRKEIKQLKGDNQ